MTEVLAERYLYCRGVLLLVMMYLLRFEIGFDFDSRT